MMPYASYLMTEAKLKHFLIEMNNAPISTSTKTNAKKKGNENKLTRNRNEINKYSSIPGTGIGSLAHETAHCRKNAIFISSNVKKCTHKHEKYIIANS